jgi:hypothetical protein
MTGSADAAQTWGRLRVPYAQHEIDKQIAAIAWVHDLTALTFGIQAHAESRLGLHMDAYGSAWPPSSFGTDPCHKP